MLVVQVKSGKIFAKIDAVSGDGLEILVRGGEGDKGENGRSVNATLLRKISPRRSNPSFQPTHSGSLRSSSQFMARTAQRMDLFLREISSFGILGSSGLTKSASQ